MPSANRGSQMVSDLDFKIASWNEFVAILIFDFREGQAEGGHL